MLHINVLGDIEAWQGTARIAIGPDQRRVLLGLLAVNANRTVAVDVLARHLWGPQPPDGAKASIQAHVSRLRADLFAGGDAGEIVTNAGGYRLDVDEDTVDLSRFDRWVAGARQMTDERAKDAYAAALRLWRGPALATARYAESLRMSLAEKRMLVFEDYVDCRLRLHEYRDVLPELMAAANEHLFRPRLAASLITALHQAGRAAEALEHYDLVRRRLVEDTGLEPPDTLRTLQQAVLRGAPLAA